METSDIGLRGRRFKTRTTTSKCYEPDRAQAKRIIVTFYARTLFGYNLGIVIKISINNV